MKIADIAQRNKEATETPVEESSMSMELRGVLHAYWRAQSLRKLGYKITVRLVADYAQDDIGYGSVVRSKVGPLLIELREIGWKIVVDDEKPLKEPKARVERPVATPKPLKEFKADVAQKRSRPNTKKDVPRLSGESFVLTESNELLGPRDRSPIGKMVHLA